MPYAYRIHPTRSLIVITGSRYWSGEDLLESRDRVTDQADYAPTFDWLYDLRRVRRIHFSPQQMRRAVKQFHRLRENGWVGCDSRSVLVGRDRDVRLTGEVYYRKVDCAFNQYRITHSLAEAYNWLSETAGRTVATETES